MEKVLEAIPFLIYMGLVDRARIVDMTDAVVNSFNNHRAWVAHKVGKEQGQELGMKAREDWVQKKTRQWEEAHAVDVEASRWAWNVFFHIAMLNPAVSQNMLRLPWSHTLNEVVKVRPL